MCDLEFSHNNGHISIIAVAFIDIIFHIRLG